MYKDVVLEQIGLRYVSERRERKVGLTINLYLKHCIYCLRTYLCDFTGTPIMSQDTESQTFGQNFLICG